jgi:ppGpp synthetase/RelA/SpoT-type nucleotidyltranferase
MESDSENEDHIVDPPSGYKKLVNIQVFKSFRLKHELDKLYADIDNYQKYNHNRYLTERVKHINELLHKLEILTSHTFRRLEHLKLTPEKHIKDIHDSDLE